MVFLATDQCDLTNDRDWTPAAPRREQLAIIQYTSGSTSDPKGVMLTHANLLANLHQIAANVDFAGAVVANWLPTYHDMGLIGAAIAPWYRGRRCIMLSPLAFFQQPIRWLRAISKYGVTSSAAPNFAYDLCVKKTCSSERKGLDLSKWQVAFNGAERIRARTIERFTEAFAPYGFRRPAFYPCYGLAESTLMVSGGPRFREPIVNELELPNPTRPPAENDAAEQNVRQLVSCGSSVVDAQVIIVDPETCRQLPPGHVGEIWVAGPQVATGYWRRPEETQQTFAAQLADGEGPFLRTGDLGLFENDELFIVGRRKELIIDQGRNHYPQDIEQTVENCDAALKPYGGAVFSVDVGDEERTVIVHEVMRPQRLDLDALMATIRAEIAASHQLDVSAIVLIKPGTIPKTSSGKTQRGVCREQFLAGTLRVVAAWHNRISNSAAATTPYVAPQTDTESLLCECWAEVLGVPRVGIHDDFFALGGQSLMATQLVTRLAPHFDVEIPLRSLFEYSTVAELAERLDQVDQQSVDSSSVDRLIDQIAAMSDQEAKNMHQNMPKPIPQNGRPTEMPKQLDYLIIGAGPAGLQLGYYLQRAGLNYRILEAGESAGTFFRDYPRHRKLLSINKVHTGYDDPEINLRWDWNSLLTDDHELLFKDYSREYMPNADDLVAYLCDFADKFQLQVSYNVRVTRISRDDVFCVEDQQGNRHYAKSVIVATGCAKPYLPEIPGIELTENYHDVSIDPENFAGQRVLILGKGNSAFETADNLIGTAALLHLVSPDSIQFAWKTHFVGHLRAVNNNFLDTYQLKSQNALLDAQVTHIRKHEGRFAVAFGYAHASGELEEIWYDRIICCTGFRFDDEIFDESCRPELVIRDRFPNMTSAWESTNVPDLYFAGTLMQQRDFKKKQSSFIHGFRYNVELLGRLLLEKYQGCPFPCDTLPTSAEALAERILERINGNSALWQQTGYTGDVLVVSPDRKTVRYWQDITCDYAHDRWAEEADHYYIVTMEFGQERIDAAPDIFAIDRPHNDDLSRAADSTGIHPIIRRYAHGKLVSTHHVIEDLFSEWKHAKHFEPLAEYFASEFSQRPVPGKFGPPADAQLQGRGMHENAG